MNKRSAIVLTVLTISGAAGCRTSDAQETVEPEPKRINPPPPPKMAKRPPPAQKIERKSLTDAEAGAFGKVLNERHPKLGRIFASADGGCHTYPPADKPLPPGGRMPPVAVDCPPFMLLPEWGHCVGDALLMADDLSQSCACLPSGNPPPPGFSVPCPSEG